MSRASLVVNRWVDSLSLSISLGLPIGNIELQCYPQSGRTRAMARCGRRHIYNDMTPW